MACLVQYVPDAVAIAIIRMQNCIKCVKIFCMTRLSKNLHRLDSLTHPHPQKIKQEKRIKRNNTKNS
jgi:hypothetical protein